MATFSWRRSVTTFEGLRNGDRPSSELQVDETGRICSFELFEEQRTVSHISLIEEKSQQKKVSQLTEFREFM
jgi:hypothetical protein